MADVAGQLGFAEISVSHRVAPLEKIVPRGDTTLVDAYLNPVLRTYIAALQRSLPGSRLRLITSAGGLVSTEHFTGKDSVLSGPAGGVVGYARAAQAAGFEQAIGFDMGGTSTDVSRFAGRFELQYETQKAGVRMMTPLLAIETVAAGGGSICRFDGVKLVVGPESAGADPGPAAYGRGGPLTVTDLNVFLGRIPADRFPFPLHLDAVTARLADLAAEVGAATHRDYPLRALAEDLLQVANATMVKAIRAISTAKGFDPRQHVLVPFGGAGGQHATAIAAELEIPAILSHPDAGLLSAYGIGQAELERHAVAGLTGLLTAQTIEQTRQTSVQLADQLAAELMADGASRGQLATDREVEIRYRGLDASLCVALRTADECTAEFLAAHHRLYGYVHTGRELELVALRVRVRQVSSSGTPRSIRVERREIVASRSGTAWFDGRNNRFLSSIALISLPEIG